MRPGQSAGCNFEGLPCPLQPAVQNFDEIREDFQQVVHHIAQLRGHIRFLQVNFTGFPEAIKVLFDLQV